MILMNRIFNIDKTYQFLLISLAFLMPLTVFGANLVIVLICVLWLVSGEYTSKFQKIINSKLMLVSILFFCIHLIGLAWTEDLNWGLHITHKMWYFLLLFPILYTIVSEKNIKYYIYSFLFAISITEIASYLVWFELIAPFKNATIENPTPFMSHISYNPILAFAIYIVLHEIFFNKKISNLIFSLYIFFGFSMIVNMFITGGRSGHVIFFVMLVVLIFQVFDKQRIKSLIAICLVIPVVFITAYQQSELFKERVDSAFFEIISYDNQSNNSVGLRLNFAINSVQIVKENLILGVGTGDFPGEYSRINKENSPSLPNTSNPHNMYLLVISQTGVVGLISLLSIFYYQINLSFRSSNKLIRDLGISLPIMFLVLMFGDSYLLGHYTTLMFVFFSSFLYKDFEKS
jgi:O-antigen ligase